MSIQPSLTSIQLNDVFNLNDQPSILLSAHLFMMRLTLDLAALKSDNNLKGKREELFKVLADYHRRWREMIKKTFCNNYAIEDLEKKVEDMLLTLNDKAFNVALQSSILEINTLASFITNREKNEDK